MLEIWLVIIFAKINCIFSSNVTRDGITRRVIQLTLFGKSQLVSHVMVE